MSEISYNSCISGIRIYHDPMMDNKKVYVGRKQNENGIGTAYKFIVTNCNIVDFLSIANDLSKPLPKIKHLTF